MISKAAVATILLLALGACDDTGVPAPNKASAPATGNLAADGAATPVPADAIAVVNGKPITTTMYELYKRAHADQQGQGIKPDDREQINELINLELLSQAAEKDDLQNTPAVAGQLEFQRASILAEAMIEKLLRRIHLSDNDIKEEYKKHYRDRKHREYKTRNILVNNREEAKRIIGKLRRGADFAQLAREKSIGPAASAGGALEWFKPEDVLKKFAAAVAQLDKGEFSTTPVKTRYGWNVILLEDYRNIPPPPLKDVEHKIRLELTKQRLDAYVDQLRTNAKIEIKRP